MKNKNKIMTLFNQDAIQGCKDHIKSNSIDLVITDPPYGISGETLDKHYNRDDSNVISGYIDIPQKQYQKFSLDFVKQIERILRPGGSCYIISGWSNLHHILNALHSTTLKERGHIIWQYSFGVYTKNKYVSSHYHILYWTKPPLSKIIFNPEARFPLKSKECYHDKEDVWTINRQYRPGEKKNINQLPEALVEKMIMYSSNPGDKVLDLFLGGFTTAFVAKRMGRVPLGFELNKKAFQCFYPKLDKITEEKSSGDMMEKFMK